MEIVDSLCSCIAIIKKVTGTVKADMPAIKTADKSTVTGMIYSPIAALSY
jgi:hypothetical protein